jgi:hypothetical protein
LFLAIVRIDFSPVEGFQPGRFLTYQPWYSCRSLALYWSISIYFSDSSFAPHVCLQFPDRQFNIPSENDRTCREGTKDFLEESLISCRKSREHQHGVSWIIWKGLSGRWCGCVASSVEKSPSGCGGDVCGADFLGISQKIHENAILKKVMEKVMKVWWIAI